MAHGKLRSNVSACILMFKYTKREKVIVWNMLVIYNHVIFNW